MPYYIGYKITHTSNKIFVYSFKDCEEALKHYDRLKKDALPDEIFIPPFLAKTEEKAREEAKKFL